MPIVKTRQISESTMSSPTTAYYNVLILGRSTSWVLVPATWNAFSPIGDVNMKEYTEYIRHNTTICKMKVQVKPNTNR